jgi:archaellum component FlaC
MEQYISKSAVKAEIKGKIENINLNYINAGSHPSDTDVNKRLQDGISKSLQSLLSFLDTLDVKEVDLEKESELIADDIMINVQASKYHTHVYSTTRCDFNHSHLMLAARKGIELGLKSAQE